MSRDPLQTVTLPIVVNADRHDKIEGWGTLFPSPNRTSFACLQVVTQADIWKQLEKWKRSQPEIRRLCGGISAIRSAYEARDEAAFRRALENVWKWVPQITGRATVKPLETEQAWKGTNLIYSRLMANLLQSSRLIFLYTEKSQRPIRPCLYCPNWETAAFAFIGTGLIRECPKCHELFIPSAGNVDYCTPAHGVAYRTARSRWRAKQKKARKSLR